MQHVIIPSPTGDRSRLYREIRKLQFTAAAKRNSRAARPTAPVTALKTALAAWREAETARDETMYLVEIETPARPTKRMSPPRKGQKPPTYEERLAAYEAEVAAVEQRHGLPEATQRAGDALAVLVGCLAEVMQTTTEEVKDFASALEHVDKWLPGGLN